jgi:hypothetical protein
MRQSVRSLGGNRQLQGLVMGLVVLGLMWGLASWIVAGSGKALLTFGLSTVMCAMIVHILKDWRSGVLIFLIWLLFEDLARKYLGNSMVVYFAKDFLLGIAYISFYFAKRRREVNVFEAPFLIPFIVFFFFASIQVFNFNSPSIFYGFLGMKLYFYYAPLMFLGYGMIRSPKDLDNLLLLTLAAGILIALLGVAQSVLGLQFLTPDDIAPELYGMTHVSRFSPVTHQESIATSSVFVSAGRFSFYLVLLWIMAVGAQGYLLISRRRGVIYGFVGIGVVTAAVMVAGTRTPFVFMMGSGLMLTAGFLWGAPWRWGQGHRLVKALRRTLAIGAIGVILLAEVFPDVFGGRWNYLSETLSIQEGQGSELKTRGWDYPLENLVQAYNQEHWIWGNGTGTNSLGAQYVAGSFGVPMAQIGGENGFATLISEMGILGPALWIFWVVAALWSMWKAVKEIRQTVYFPIGFAIWWYCIVSLVLLFYLTMTSYQDFVNCAYMWLLIGVLFRLPKLAQMPQPVPIPRNLRGVPRWRLALIGK